MIDYHKSILRRKMDERVLGDENLSDSACQAGK